MAEICCELLSENENNKSSSPCERRAARRRRMEIRRVKFVAGVPVLSNDGLNKRQKQPAVSSYASSSSSFSIDFRNAVEQCYSDEKERTGTRTFTVTDSDLVQTGRSSVAKEIIIPYVFPVMFGQYPKYGLSSVCGRRRDMEDAIAIHPSFCGLDEKLDFYGVYDGHGCSHVAMKCRDRLHNVVKEEMMKNRNEELFTDLYNVLEKSFNRMDKEVIACNHEGSGSRPSCRCELRTPECDAVGSTAVVSIVSPEKIVVANCGDSRAVLCRNGKPIPLSYDHKPDRPDELNRIQSAGGRVIYWEGARVLGVLAMSRAIGDTYLKPYVCSEPEITVSDRTAEDDLLILASDGLWDVVSNDTACAVARMCLRGKTVSIPPSSSSFPEIGSSTGYFSDKACSDAAMLLTKLALARHSTDNVSVVVVDLKRDT